MALLQQVIVIVCLSGSTVTSSVICLILLSIKCVLYRGPVVKAGAEAVSADPGPVSPNMVPGDVVPRDE